MSEKVISESSDESKDSDAGTMSANITGFQFDSNKITVKPLRMLHKMLKNYVFNIGFRIFLQHLFVSQ